MAGEGEEDEAETCDEGYSAVDPELDDDDAANLYGQLGSSGLGRGADESV